MTATCKSAIEITSAYHLNGIFGNSGTNSNGTVHPGGKFTGKKVIHFEVFPFSRLQHLALHGNTSEKEC